MKTMEINIDEIVVKIKFVEQKILKAIISLDFGSFVIKGFRVLESKYENIKGDKLWLVPPSYQGVGGKYHPIFFIPNKEVWLKLETRIWEEYYKQSKEYHKKQFDLREEDL